MTKVDIISGFLGAGKTTLIKKLLAEALADEQVVLIENEFGEIGIDGGFLKDSGIEITEMNSGCICCSLVGDFANALKEVIDTYHPDRIIIEPSGVGKLSDVIKAVQDADLKDAVLNSFVTVIDGKKCRMYMKNFGEFYNNQIEYAGSILMSRTGDMQEEKLADAVALVKEKNDTAAIVTTPWDELTGEKILSVMEDGDQMAKELMEGEDICPVCGHHHDHDHHDHDHHDHDHHDHDHHDHHDHDHHDHDHHDHDHHDHHHDHDHHDHDHHDHHHADDVFTSIGFTTTKSFVQDELEEMLHQLSEDETYGTILRAKGIVKGEGQWFYFDYVPGESEVRTGEPDISGRICVIGAEVKEDKVKELFHIN